MLYVETCSILFCLRMLLYRNAIIIYVIRAVARDQLVCDECTPKFMFEKCVGETWALECHANRCGIYVLYSVREKK